MFVTEIEFQNPIEGQINEKLADTYIRSFMDDIADKAYDLFIFHMPFSSGKMLNALSRGDVNKHPGGIWTVSVGIEPIIGADDPRYPLYVHEGTGIFKRGGNFDSIDARESAVIYPEHGNVMVFEKKGEGAIFTRWVEGQKPQPFSDKVEAELEPYITVRKRQLGAIMNLLLKTS